jgi:uncharacterized protein with von Willebrand factor type A (vWA) domain
MSETSDPPTATVETSSPASALLRFVHRLRDASVPVSMVEALDAMQSIRHLDLANRPQLRAALSATLVKRVEHQPAFHSLFDLYFPSRGRRSEDEEGPTEVGTSLDRLSPDEGQEPAPGAPGRGGQGGASTDLLRALLDALRSGDDNALRDMAALAVGRFGGMDAERPATERYYVYRVLRQLELSELLRRGLAEEREEADERTPLEERLARDELVRRIEEFRRLIAEEIRRHLVELKGAQQAAEVLHDRSVEDVDFLRASPAELERMRAAIRPLAQKLAARIAHRRRLRRHGRLDVRRTVRRSLSAGGVPLDPAFRYPKPSRPDLYLLCDISGSVAEFAQFTISLLYAMKEEFSRIRLFVFVDGIDEVTSLMDRSGPVLAPRNLLYRTNAISGDGHSDYGNVLRRFWHRYGHADLDPRATVIITGDARNNYRGSGEETLRLIHDRARKVYWLNPEPRRDWDTTDSIMASYASLCHGVFEARNLHQLAQFVYEIA